MIQNREGQLGKIIATLEPLDLAKALSNKGELTCNGLTRSLGNICDITTNTQNVLCRIADNVELLNKLQTVSVPDVPKSWCAAAARVLTPI